MKINLRKSLSFLRLSCIIVKKRRSGCETMAGFGGGNAAAARVCAGGDRQGGWHHFGADDGSQDPAAGNRYHHCRCIGDGGHDFRRPSERCRHRRALRPAKLRRFARGGDDRTQSRPLSPNDPPHHPSNSRGQDIGAPTHPHYGARHGSGRCVGHRRAPVEQRRDGAVVLAKCIRQTDRRDPHLRHGVCRCAGTAADARVRRLFRPLPRCKRPPERFRARRPARCDTRP